MRPASIMLSLILVFSLCLCLGLNSYLCLSTAGAVEAGVIAEPSVPIPNMDMPAPKITPPTMNMPETSAKAQSDQASSNESGQTQSQADGGEDSLSGGQGELDAISGKWSIRFQELKDRRLDLTLWSSGKEKIMGFGTLTKGSSIVSMSASGSFAADELLLAVKSAQPEYEGGESDHYDLDLFLKNDTISGTYILWTDGELSASGNTTASRRA